MTDRIEEFIRDSQAYIGREADDVPPGAELADWLTIRRFCAALGDQNPLYKDPAHGVGSKYHAMIAPQTFIAAIRTPTAGAAYVHKDYGVGTFLTSASMELVDVVRSGDRFKSSLMVTGVKDGPGWKDRRTAQVMSRAEYRNSYGGLIGTSTGTVDVMPFERGKEFFDERDIYSYSDDEIKAIKKGIESEPPPRGRHVRYWNDVKVGERLPVLVKGPMSLQDMMAWSVAEQKVLALGTPIYQALKKMPGRVRTNPTTNWPYWDADQEFEDILSCQDLGFKAPVGRGMQRVCLAGHLASQWMGDDGFLRSLEAEMPRHWLYGDTMWLTGDVIDKYKEKVGKELYHAAVVRIIGYNQLKETILRGRAVVYLPNPGYPVELPIPHPDWSPYPEL
jgi:hypothetical protein